MSVTHPLFEPDKFPVLPIVAAVAGSLVFHASLPMLDRVKVPQPETRSLVDFLPMETPDDLGDVDNVPEPPQDEPAPEEPAPEEPPPPVEPDKEDPVPDEEKGVEVPPEGAEQQVPEVDPGEKPAEPPADQEPTPQEDIEDIEPIPTRDARFTRRLHRREAEILAARKKRAEEWKAKREARKKAREEAREKRKAKNRRQKKEVGPVPDALKKGGQPNAVWVCDATSKGFRADVRAERDTGDWVGLVPTVLLVFPTSPNLVTVMGDAKNIKKRKRKYQRKLGMAEFALPDYEIEVDIDGPPGTTAYLGRDDVRCLIGVKYKKKDLFPMELIRVPMRIVMKSGRTVHTLVDIEFLRDGSFELHARDDEGAGAVPFEKGRLANAGLIEETIDSHLFAAETLNDMGKMIGIDVGKMMRDKRRKTAKAKSQHQRNMEKLERMKREQQAKKNKAKKPGKAAPPPAPGGDDERPKRRGRRGRR